MCLPRACHGCNTRRQGALPRPLHPHTDAAPNQAHRAGCLPCCSCLCGAARSRPLHACTRVVGATASQGHIEGERQMALRGPLDTYRTECVPVSTAQSVPPLRIKNARCARSGWRHGTLPTTCMWCGSCCRLRECAVTQGSGREVPPVASGTLQAAPVVAWVANTSMTVARWRDVFVTFTCIHAESGSSS